MYERNKAQNRVVDGIPYPSSVLVIPSEKRYTVNMTKSAGVSTTVVKIDGEFEIIAGEDLLQKIGFNLKNMDLPRELRLLCGTL